MSLRVPAIAAIVAACVLVGALPTAAFTTRDMLGREVTLASPPRRIVSLVPSVTEILFALNAESLLVGVTDFCDFPPEARLRPKVGGMVAPSLEAISAVDGSVGWCPMINCDSGYASAFIDQDVARAMYADINVATASSVTPLGTAARPWFPARRPAANDS